MPGKDELPVLFGAHAWCIICLGRSLGETLSEHQDWEVLVRTYNYEQDAKLYLIGRKHKPA